MKSTLLALLGLCLAAACASPHHDKVIPEGAAVIIHSDHIHTRYCGHYKFHDQWYYIPMHKHGVNCGHELVDGEWCLLEKPQ